MTYSTENQNMHLLRDLFPYDIENIKNAALRKALHEYAFFLNALSEAAHHFQNGDLEKFDALVGENACQIRAIKIAIIASKNDKIFEHINDQITTAQEKLSVILRTNKIENLMHSNMPLKEILKAEKLEISLTYQQLFLFHSFLLCEMKELEATGDILSSLTTKDKSVPKKLMRFSNAVSVNFTNCVLNKTRRHMAENSVNFVRKTAADLKDCTLIQMTSKEFTFEHNTLPCMPMFWSYKTLLKIAQKESVPLVIHAQFIRKEGIGYKIMDEEVLFFKPNNDENGPKYIQTSEELIEFKMPACVIQGVVCTGLEKSNPTEWKEKMATHSVIDIILAGAADHPQYPINKNEIAFSDLEFDNYRLIAKNNGFSIENPNTFFINHVFSMQIGRVSNLMKSY